MLFRKTAADPDSASNVADDAEFEGLPASCLSRVPSLVASDTLELKPQQLWRVRLAMTHINGEPLDSYMERCRVSRLRKYASKRPTLPQLRQDVAQAAYVTRELLVQLAPAFEHISSVALHRDVNAHNILIDNENDGPPSFGLVDFGLAVDETCWRMEESESSSPARPSRVGQDGVCTWHHLDVGGDCRYWPISAWLQFLYGCTELALHATLCHEYLNRLDLHSLGVTALQLFVEMLPQMGPNDDSKTHCFGDGAATSSAWPKKIAALQCAWREYWDTVSPLHGALMSTFHNGGDWDALKRDCIDHNVKSTIQELLVNLRGATDEAGESCKHDMSLCGFRELCDALRLMIGCGRDDDDCADTTASGPQNWRRISRTLGKGAKKLLDGVTPPPAPGPRFGTSAASTASTPGCGTLSSPRSQGASHSVGSVEERAAGLPSYPERSGVGHDQEARSHNGAPCGRSRTKLWK